MSRSAGIAAIGCAWRVRQDGRPAITHYRVLERFRAHTYLRVKLETGRTHQIRLHLAHLQISDRRRSRVRRPLRAPARRGRSALIETLRGFKRQALHAATLAFDHPRIGRAADARKVRCRRTLRACSTALREDVARQPRRA